MAMSAGVLATGHIYCQQETGEVGQSAYVSYQMSIDVSDTS